MSTKHDSHEQPAPAGGHKRRRFHWSTIIAAAVCVPVALLALRSGREWSRLSQRQSEVENELATLGARNAVLKPASEMLEHKKFMVCNKNPNPVTIRWLAAVYQDGRRLKLFDPSRCQGWRPEVIPSGAQKLVNFSSPEEVCNWSGSVIFFAMRYSYESADGLTSTLDYAGPWAGFDRDCYTVN